MTELVNRDKNHPSVVMWSVGNEPKSYRNASGDIRLTMTVIITKYFRRVFQICSWAHPPAGHHQARDSGLQCSVGSGQSYLWKENELEYLLWRTTPVNILTLSHSIVITPGTATQATPRSSRRSSIMISQTGDKPGVTVQCCDHSDALQYSQGSQWCWQSTGRTPWPGCTWSPPWSSPRSIKSGKMETAVNFIAFHVYRSSSWKKLSRHLIKLGQRDGL